MKQFISCIELGKEFQENVLLNMDAVKIIRRYYRDEREDIVEDYDGNHYVCHKPVFESGEEVGYEDIFERCILTFGAEDERKEKGDTQ